jgi:DNA-3-methyladenine glycosylase
MFSASGISLKIKSRINVMSTITRLGSDFYTRDVLEVAPELIGKELVVRSGDKIRRRMITEVEAYRGAEDKACHASKGRTKRTEIMYHEGGRIYVYLIYGMYWLINVVANKTGVPEAALIRGVEGCYGPGRLTRLMEIDGSFYGEDLTISERIWITDSGKRPQYSTGTRIGIGYAGHPWTEKPWRYFTTSL